MSKISDIQQILGVKADGQWGPKSQAALDAAKHENGPWFVGKASSFADPKDIAAFKRCKAQGHSDVYCFGYGDNGRGQWDDDTTEGSGPCCAVPGSRMVERWGSWANAKHKKIEVVIGMQSLVLPVKDRLSEDLSSGAVIDLNPDAGAFFGLNPPFMVPVRWRWTGD